MSVSFSYVLKNLSLSVYWPQGIHIKHSVLLIVEEELKSCATSAKSNLRDIVLDELEKKMALFLCLAKGDTAGSCS